MPKDFGVTGRDRTWNLYAQSFLSANHDFLNALGIQHELKADRDQVNLYLWPSGSVGAVPLLSPVTRNIVGGLIVEPRFGWNGIGPMLNKMALRQNLWVK